ncbi:MULTISPECIES: hypothetical protein [unclassified Chryseobacterium]|uniref:hypothetical protein n=1 Tax=unclassified Chryseobacterium TaxID=2593645 RepID=UPI003016B067
MPTLKEYLGGIVSEITAARKMADIQTLEIAQEYAQDNLLKHFSVPRMKVGTVELTVPFAKAAASPALSFSDFTYEEITKNAKTDYDASDVKNDKELKVNLMDKQNEYDKVIISLKRQNITFLTPNEIKFFKDISNYVVEFCYSLSNFSLEASSKDSLIEKVHRRILTEAEKALQNTPDNSNEVIVEASKLMDLDPKCIIIAKMSVTESGMEWSRHEDIDGNIVETLIPE